MEIVLQILVFSKLTPEDLDATFGDLGLWIEFIDWFFFLRHHNYFWEAHRTSQSLFYALPRPECQDLVQAYLAQALSANIDQESVKIAVSSMVQHFIYAFKSTSPSVLAVISWNDAMTWALFGVTLGEADEGSTSLFSRIGLRQSLELELDIYLPLDGENEDGGLSDLLHEATRYGDTALLEAITALPSTFTLEQFNLRAFSSAGHLYSHNKLPFRSSEIVNAQDGYQRTPLHWASLMAQDHAVEALLSVGKADAGLLDWFGCTPLHYAIRSCAPRVERECLRVIKALLKSDSASVNTRDLAGQTPLNMAIDEQSYDVAKILLENDATIEVRDYGALLLIGGNNIDWLSSWKRLLSKYDHSQPSILSDRLEFEAPARLFFKKASLYHRGLIDLDTYAALCLRALHPDYTAELLPRLRALLECEFSVYDLPATSQVQSYIREGQRSSVAKPIGGGGDTHQALLDSLESMLQVSN